MGVILSEAKNLACETQMLRLWLSMTANQIICDKVVTCKSAADMLILDNVETGCHY
jgi:hypothetical protein